MTRYRKHLGFRLPAVILVLGVVVLAGCSDRPPPSPERIAQGYGAMPVLSASSPCGGDFGMLGEIQNTLRGWWSGLEHPLEACR